MNIYLITGDAGIGKLALAELLACNFGKSHTLILKEPDTIRRTLSEAFAHAANGLVIVIRSHISHEECLRWDFSRKYHISR